MTDVTDKRSMTENKTKTLAAKIMIKTLKNSTITVSSAA